jgi:hypothetical protein
VFQVLSEEGDVALQVFLGLLHDVQVGLENLFMALFHLG